MAELKDQLNNLNVENKAILATGKQFKLKGKHLN